MASLSYHNHTNRQQYHTLLASMRDNLNRGQTMELDEDDVAILDGTFDIGIDQLSSIPRDEPTPGYNWINNSGEAFLEGRYSMNDSESDDSDDYSWMNEMLPEDYTYEVISEDDMDRVIEPEDDMDEVNESADDTDEVNESVVDTDEEDMHDAVGQDTSDNSGSGLSEETIMKSLQVSTPKTKIGGKGEGEKEEIDTCAICCGEYEENKQIGKLQCGHLFHVECLISWLPRKNSCPMCRATALTV